MGKVRYKIVKETGVDGEYGHVWTSFRVKKRFLGIWFDIGGRGTKAAAEKLMKNNYLENHVRNYYNGQIIPDDEVVGEYEF